MNHARFAASSFLFVLGAVLALPSCESTPSNEPAPSTASTAGPAGPGATAPEKAGPAAPARTKVEFKNELNATAEVVAVEKETRLVTLRREDGQQVVLQVGEAARNFDQIAIGDKVRVKYAVGVAATLQPAGSKVQPATAMAGSARAKAGEKPGGGMGIAISAKVKIESIDVAHDIVVFSSATGELIAHRLATPEGKEFAKGLKVGDIVQLDYAEGVALSVETL